MLEPTLSITAITIAAAALVLSYLSFKRTNTHRDEENRNLAGRITNDIRYEMYSLRRKNTQLGQAQIALHAARGTYHSGSREKDEQNRKRVSDRLDTIDTFRDGLAQKTNKINGRQLLNHIADLETTHSMLKEQREVIEEDQIELEKRRSVFEGNRG
ncbi:hypothetical protein [uncultured Roseovarius sp.]|uniref:hypothetical protein n=1 Tax=uncultured Roseovarius sp. TaxID=293344 RepID=UPI00260E3CA0|nr:hypothetical protein [uncultured Roseovarius sp.]